MIVFSYCSIVNYGAGNVTVINSVSDFLINNMLKSKVLLKLESL